MLEVFSGVMSSFGLGVEILMRSTMSIIKYFIVAGAGYYLFYVWKRKDWFKYKIQEKMPSAKHLRHEIFWSVVSRIIIGFLLVAIVHNLGYSQVYFDISEYGIAYLIASALGLVVIHDAYFYWAHWLMHKPALYKYVHKVHHHSTNPTPLASFAFHPSEALAEIAIFPLLLFLVPLHPGAILFLVAFQLIFNVYGHSGYELMPRWWVTHPVAKYFNTSTHHNLHHKEFHYNFGLYFNHWDRWVGTLDPDYEKKFYAIKDRSERIAQEEKEALEITHQTAH